MASEINVAKTGIIQVSLVIIIAPSENPLSIAVLKDGLLI